jgi:hypothetical protein
MKRNYLISVMDPMDGRVYINEAGFVVAKGQAVFTGNEAQAGDAAHLWAQRWGLRFDCFVKGVEIEIMP